MSRAAVHYVEPQRSVSQTANPLLVWQEIVWLCPLDPPLTHNAHYGPSPCVSVKLRRYWFSTVSTSQLYVIAAILPSRYHVDLERRRFWRREHARVLFDELEVCGDLEDRFPKKSTRFRVHPRHTEGNVI